jgi:glutamine synthetase
MEQTPVKTDPVIKNFLELSYEELEDLNLKARTLTDPEEAERTHTQYLRGEKAIKAVTVCFSDIEGRLHMLDYDKRFFLDSLSNLTFDGSSIKGFSELHESDLRLSVDWTSFTYLPTDVFGPGKVAVFANVCNRDLTPYESDFRGRLQAYARELFAKDGTQAYMAPELEGFLLAAARPAAAVYRRHRRGAARHGFPQRKGPPRSGAVTI